MESAARNYEALTPYERLLVPTKSYLCTKWQSMVPPVPLMSNGVRSEPLKQNLVPSSDPGVHKDEVQISEAPACSSYWVFIFRHLLFDANDSIVLLPEALLYIRHFLPIIGTHIFRTIAKPIWLGSHVA